MHSKNDNTEMPINDKAHKVIENVLGLMDVKIIWKHQWEVVILSFIVFVFINYYKCHEINLNRGGSCIDFLT